MRELECLRRGLRLPVVGGRIAGAAISLAASLAARDARAQASDGGTCHGPQIVESAPLTQAWSQTLEDARAVLHAATNLDRCALILLQPHSSGLRVRVSLEDGRGATRDIAKSTELLPTLKGLLFLPPAERSTIETWREPSQTADETPRATASSPSVPHFEAGLGAMGRMAGSPLYLGIGAAAFAQADLGAWLFGVVARWDAADFLVSEAVPSGFNMQTLAVGIEAGHRAEFRLGTLDLLFGPQVRVENQEAFGGEATPDGIGGGTSDIRLDAAARMILASSKPIRFFGEVDLDASPRRLSRTRRLDPQLPALPSWSAGLTLGALARLP